MSSFLFVNGQIRALESKLLSPERLDRMVGAKTPEDAFRVLVELQYAEYFNEAVKPQDFTAILEQGLLETKDLVVKGTEDSAGLQFIWKRFDLNNIKRAYKLKFQENQETLGEFTEENGFCALGDVSAKDLEILVFSEKDPENIPTEYIKVAEKAEAVYAETEDFHKVETLLDQAHFASLSRLAKKSMSSFLNNLFHLTVDATNFRTLMRSILILEKPLDKDTFIPYGSFDWKEVSAIETEEDLWAWAREARFYELLTQFKETHIGEEKVLIIEKALDGIMNEFLHDAQFGAIDTIQVPLAYFERRLQNAKMIKFIMFAKFHGMDSDTIYKTLKQI
jgi:V/A-type H+/Na+-transporting ATPase subunit C